MLRVRDLSPEEGEAINRTMNRTRDPTVMRRAQVVLHSNQGFSPPKIARMVFWSEEWVRRVIKDFNRMGKDALFPTRAGGRPPTFTPTVRQALVDLALSPPKEHGYTVGPWTLDRLRSTAVMSGIVESISKERLREILHEEAVSFQAVKTWKQSTDPRFREKVKRLRALMNREHNPPIVVAVDEMGPISLKPYGGRTWARSGHPDRVRATYNRFGGVRHLMGMYDYFHRTLRGYLSPRKRGANWVRFLRYVRRWYPSGERIYLVQDNFSAHTTREARREARQLKISLVPIPTNSSHLNPIETHFRSIREIALTGTDFQEWRALGGAIQGAMRELNARHSAPAHKVKRCLWVRH
ncbi:MAG: IS630 family transposase [Thermoplasmata archaeon]